MNKTYLITGTLGCLFVAGLLLLQRHGPVHPPVADPALEARQLASEQAHGPSPFSSGPAAVEADQAHVPRPQPASRDTAASREFFSTDNLKSLIANARSNPSAGSFFYATMAIRECEQYATSLPMMQAEAAKMSPKRAAAVAVYATRCKDVNSRDMALLRRLGDEGIAAGDIGFASLTPLSSKIVPIGDPARSSRRDRLLEGLYSAPDAGVVWAVANELALSSDGLSVSGHAMNEIERSSLPAAILLAGCELGVPCDARHPLLRWSCVSSALCDATSLQELFRQVDSPYWAPYTEATRFDIQTAMRLRDRILRGIADGDRSVLTYRRPPS